VPEEQEVLMLMERTEQHHRFQVRGDQSQQIRVQAEQGGEVSPEQVVLEALTLEVRVAAQPVMELVEAVVQVMLHLLAQVLAVMVVIIRRAQRAPVLSPEGPVVHFKTVMEPEMQVPLLAEAAVAVISYY
jgi:hypothetical protein